MAVFLSINAAGWLFIITNGSCHFEFQIKLPNIPLIRLCNSFIHSEYKQSRHEVGATAIPYLTATLFFLTSSILDLFSQAIVLNHQRRGQRLLLVLHSIFLAMKIL